MRFDGTSNPVAGSRVAPPVPLAAPETEAAEAAGFDPLSPVQRLHDAAEHGENDVLRALPRQVGGLGHLLDECRLRQAAIGHGLVCRQRGGVGVAATRARP